MSENGQAMDAIREVGPGKHFLGCAHTQANFETAFYRSPITDNNSFEQWEAEGSRDLAQRANASWKKQLAEYEAPAMDVATDEAILDYVNRRKASFPDSTSSPDHPRGGWVLSTARSAHLEQFLVEGCQAGSSQARRLGPESAQRRRPSGGQPATEDPP